MSASGRALASLVDRELSRLRSEIGAYEDESDLWRVQGAQKNPPGTLALHLVGNLSSYVGADLGGSGYVRDRAAEFSERGVPREEILRRLDACRAVVVPTLERLTEDDLARPFPGAVPESWAGVSTHHWLLQCLWHLGWHSGQVYYHRLALEQPD